MEQTTKNFYKNLESHSYTDRNPSLFFDTLINESKILPYDWYIISTDIVHAISTPTSKKYLLHFISTACISVLLNKAKQNNIEIPFLYNGDGSIAAFPEAIKREIVESLLSFQKYCKVKFDIEIRIGILSYKEVRELYGTVCILKNLENEHMQESLFLGDGISKFTQAVRNQGKHLFSYLDFVYLETFSLENFSCPWKSFSIPNSKDFAVSLIVETKLSDFESSMSTISRIADLIDTHIGNLHERSIEPTLLDNYPHYKIGYISLIERNIVFKVIHYVTKGVHTLVKKFINLFIHRSKKQISFYSDSFKIDNGIKTVFFATRSQWDSLKKELDAFKDRGIILYGFHISKEILVTCFIENKEMNTSLRFIDGDGNGYLSAHEMLMKQKLNI